MLALPLLWMNALWPSTAAAGSGPWVLGPGASSVYAAAEGQRFSTLSFQESPGKTDQLEVAEGVTAFGLKGIATVGLLPRLEVELSVPWQRAQVNRPDAEPCAALGLGACRTTSGLGVLAARGKVLVLDELYGSPVSASLGGELRHGLFAAADRERITNLGEGTIDAGLFAAVGRSAGLGGDGYWSAFVEGGARYRFPNTDSYPGADGGVPAPEYLLTGELLAAPGSARVAIGPVVTGLFRPGGVEWYDLDLADPDRFAALKIGTVRAGGSVLVRGPSDMSLSVSALRSVYAYNNPSDTLLVTAGISVYHAPEAEEP